jgi:hypothetical protein
MLMKRKEKGVSAHGSVKPAHLFIDPSVGQGLILDGPIARR